LGRRTQEASESIRDREVIWQWSMKYALARPVTGYGYGGFWTPQHIDSVNATVGRGVVASSHSNYIELLLDVGVVGSLTFVMILFLGVKKAFINFRRYGRDPNMVITIQLICFLALVSIFEINANLTYIHLFVIYVLISKAAFINDNLYKNSFFEANEEHNQLRSPVDLIGGRPSAS